MPDEDCGIWLKGREFLLQAEEYWAARPVDLPPVDDDEPGIKTVKLVNVITPHVNDCISTHSANVTPSIFRSDRS